jgi:hypothetical protein
LTTQLTLLDLPYSCFSAYSLEIFDPDQPEIALAKFALSPFPIHHPNGMDLAIIHLKQEETGMYGYVV